MHTSQPSPPPVFIGGIAALDATFADFVNDTTANIHEDSPRDTAINTADDSRDRGINTADGRAPRINTADRNVDSIVDAGTDGKRKKSGGKKAQTPAAGGKKKSDKRKAGCDLYGNDATDNTNDQNNSLRDSETAGEPTKAGQKGGDAIIRRGDHGSRSARKLPAKKA